MIRPAVKADIPDLARVHVQAWQDAYSGLLPDETIAGMTIERRAAMWERIIESDQQRSWVAETETGLVGLASVGPAADPLGWGHVYNIYVVAGAWGTGAGSGLWEAAQLGLDRLGYRDRQLYVLDTNRRARRFYEYKGWEHDGTVILDDTFGAPIREVRYVPGSATTDR